MKKNIILLFVALLSMPVMLSAQKDNVATKLYFQLRTDVEMTFKVNANNSVDMYTVPGIPARELANEFEIIEFSRPFTLNNDAKLMRTFFVQIADEDNLDRLAKMLQNSVSVAFVEKEYETIIKNALKLKLLTQQSPHQIFELGIS